MVADLDRADFTATATGDAVRLCGTADARVAAELECWLLAVVAEQPGDRELVVDLLGLEFMTGGCVKAFVALVGALGARPLRFVANAGYAWQRRSLAALSCLAADRITIDVRDQSDSGIA